jgi:hypothetical protein
VKKQFAYVSNIDKVRWLILVEGALQIGTFENYLLVKKFYGIGPWICPFF